MVQTNGPMRRIQPPHSCVDTPMCDVTGGIGFETACKQLRPKRHGWCACVSSLGTHTRIQTSHCGLKRTSQVPDSNRRQQMTSLLGRERERAPEPERTEAAFVVCLLDLSLCCELMCGMWCCSARTTKMFTSSNEIKITKKFKKIKNSSD